MASVRELLEPLAARAEHEVRPRLGGMFGGMLRAYLPQTWVFTTEQGSASLTVDGEGRATITEGPAVPADVTVEVGHARLESALASGGRQIAPGRFEVTPHTRKGKAAFDYLRGRLGL